MSTTQILRHLLNCFFSFPSPFVSLPVEQESKYACTQYNEIPTTSFLFPQKPLQLHNTRIRQKNNIGAIRRAVSVSLDFELWGQLPASLLTFAQQPHGPSLHSPENCSKNLLVCVHLCMSVLQRTVIIICLLVCICACPSVTSICLSRHICYAQWQKEIKTFAHSINRDRGAAWWGREAAWWRWELEHAEVAN